VSALLLAGHPGSRGVRPPRAGGSRGELRRCGPASGVPGRWVPRAVPGPEGSAGAAAAVRATHPPRRPAGGGADRGHPPLPRAPAGAGAGGRGVAAVGRPAPADPGRLGGRGPRHPPPGGSQPVLRAAAPGGSPAVAPFPRRAHPQVPRLLRAPARPGRRTAPGRATAELRRPVDVPGAGGAVLRLPADPASLVPAAAAPEPAPGGGPGAAPGGGLPGLASPAGLQRGRRVPGLSRPGAAGRGPRIACATRRALAHLPGPMIHAGQQAPSFTLQDSPGKAWSRDALRAKGPVVLFFYPRDESPICTREVCSFRDAHQDFVDTGATVVGVSSDSQESHAEFARKRDLPYLLL